MANSDPQTTGSGSSAEPVTHARPAEIIDLQPMFDIDAAFPSEESPAAPDRPAPETQTAVVAARKAAATNADAPDTQKSATLVGFTPRLPAPDAAAASSTPESTESLTLLQLLESHAPVPWPEAVAIIQELCEQLKDVPSHAPVLIEPGSIQITSTGQLHLLASQQGGDPLVIQLGRLLRSIVSTEAIPSELRLLISQATFELAIFDSVEQFARALDKLAGRSPAGAVKAAFRRAVRQPVETPEPTVLVDLPTPSRPLLPAPMPHPRRKPHARRRFDGWGSAARNALSAAVLAGLTLIGYLMMKDAGVKPPQGATTQVVSPVVEQPLPGPAPVVPATPEQAAPQRLKKPSDEPPPSRPRASGRVERSPQRPIVQRPPASTASSSVPAETSRVVGRAPFVAPTGESPADLVRRASALFNAGKASDAAIVLDLLVLTAPLYEPADGALPADGSAAFRASQRLLLPNIAAREFDKASAALGAGDPDGAAAMGDRTAAMLDRFDMDSESPLRPKVQQLMRRAGALRATTENAVYGLDDSDVTPPQPLSRQFPEGAPAGIPPQRVGTLELIVGKAGDVEFVKLHTPLNRYHERMIVSAVKAWRYLPAVRAGKPVRFRLTISINLPESGNPGSQ